MVSHIYACLLTNMSHILLPNRGKNALWEVPVNQISRFEQLAHSQTQYVYVSSVYTIHTCTYTSISYTQESGCECNVRTPADQISRLDQQIRVVSHSQSHICMSVYMYVLYSTAKSSRECLVSNIVDQISRFEQLIIVSHMYVCLFIYMSHILLLNRAMSALDQISRSEQLVIVSHIYVCLYKHMSLSRSISD